MATFVSTIGDLLLCPVCKEVLREPRTLPCQHSFCHECLKTLITKMNALEQKLSDFPCPVCRNVTKLPYGEVIETQVESFPINRLVVSMMDAMLQHDNGWPKCKLHPDKCADLVCLSHDILICSKCLLTDHKHCRVMDMNDYVKSSFYSTKCTEVSDSLKGYKNHLSSLVTDISVKTNDIAKDEENLLAELECFRDTIIATFDTMQGKISSRVAVYRKQGVTCLNKQKTMLEALMSDIQTSESEMKEAEMTEISSKQLLAVRTAEANLKMVDVEMSAVSLPVTSFKLLTSAKLEAAMVMLRDSFDIAVKETVFEIPPIPPTIKTHPDTPQKGKHRMSIKEPDAVKMKSINVRLHSDNSPCDITGSAALPDGRVVLVDYNNKKLKILDMNMFKVVSDFNTDGAAFDATTVSENEVAVTVPKSKQIHFISLQDGMKTAESIQTRLECWGIDMVDNKLVTVTSNDGHMILFLTRNGTELLSCSLGSQDPNMKWPISVCSNAHDRLFVACQGEGDSSIIHGSVVMVDSVGQVRSMYMDAGLCKPTSCTSDEEGNIYVCALTSSNVHHILHTGDRLGQTISGLSKPIHIKYAHDCNCLLVSERFSDHVAVYVIQ